MDDKIDIGMSKREQWAHGIVKKTLENKGYNVIPVEKMTQSDFIRAYTSNNTRLIYFSGHGSEKSAAIATSVIKGYKADGTAIREVIAPWKLTGVTKGANLDRIIFNACYSKNYYTSGWLNVFGPDVKFYGWYRDIKTWHTNMFNTLGIFDRNPYKMF